MLPRSSAVASGFGCLQMCVNLNTSIRLRPCASVSNDIFPDFSSGLCILDVSQDSDLYFRTSGLNASVSPCCTRSMRCFASMNVDKEMIVCEIGAVS